jgi:hypothetical protein
MEITNRGDEAAAEFWLDLYFDRYSTPDVCEDGDLYGWVEYIGPGETLGFEAEIDDGPTAWWDSALYVDTCDDIAEADESNNIEWVTVYP